jgi:hypothetical protein
MRTLGLSAGSDSSVDYSSDGIGEFRTGSREAESRTLEPLDRCDNRLPGQDAFVVLRKPVSRAYP